MVCGYKIGVLKIVKIICIKLLIIKIIWNIYYCSWL